MPYGTRQLPLKIPTIDVKYDTERQVPAHCAQLGPLISLFCAGTGLGKTHALMEWVQMYEQTKTFDKIYCFSPSYHSDPKYQILEKLSPKLIVRESFTNAIWKPIYEEIVADLEGYKAYVEKLEIWKKFMAADDLSSLSEEEYETLQLMKMKKPTTPWKRGIPQSLIIFDDLSGCTDLYRADCKGPVNSFLIRSRHFKCSLVFLCQTFQNGVPRQLRQNLTMLCLWPTKNEKMQEEIAGEFANYVSMEEFISMWSMAGAVKHGFLYCDFRADRSERFRIRWDQAIARPEPLKITSSDSTQSDDAPAKPKKARKNRDRRNHSGAVEAGTTSGPP